MTSTTDTFATQPHGGNGTDRNRWIRLLGLWVVGAALISVTVTFLVLTGLTPIAPTLRVVHIALIINGALVAVLDVDSEQPAAFDDRDARGLQAVVAAMMAA